MSRRGRRPVPIDVERAAGLYRRGMTLQEIGNIMGVSRTLLSRRFRAAGVPCRPAGGRPLDLDMRWVREAYAAGATMVEIRQCLGVSLATLHKHMAAEGIERRPRGRRPHRRDSGLGRMLEDGPAGTG